MRENSKVAAAVSIDIKGAFDHLEWHRLKKEIYANYPKFCAEIIDSYLENRKLHYHGVTKDID